MDNTRSSVKQYNVGGSKIPPNFFKIALDTYSIFLLYLGIIREEKYEFRY